MTTIYKYPIAVEDLQLVRMPKGAQIIAAQTQHNMICLWAIVDQREAQMEIRTIEVFGTGHPMEEGTRKHLGTVQFADGALIFHVFERLP